MKKGFIYISILAAAVLASCVKNPVGERTLSGTGEKTPIVVVSNVNANTFVTKAVDGQWEANDVFMAYIKHVTTKGTDSDLAWQADVTGDGVGPRLANFKISGITSGHEGIADNFREHTDNSSVLTVTDAEGLYWDDFSNSADEAHDLRTANHALMSFYGYCYNGGSPNSGTELNTNDKKAAGEIGWTVAQVQTSGFKTSDLLFSGQQKPVAYSHGTASGIAGRDRVLSIPYFHAMSKVTIVLNLEDGFSSEKANLASTTVTLQGMNTVSTVTAPTLSVAPVAGDGNANVKNITAQPISTGAPNNLQKSFSALIAPTVMKADKVLAKIANVDGNDYELKLTDDVLKTAPDGKQAWSTQLAGAGLAAVTPSSNADYNAENGGLTKPGVHYMITVTIKKQQIKVEAIIKDWDAVNAEGVGQIQFDTDVKTIVTDPADLPQFTAAFDLYKTHTLPSNMDYGKKATTVIWNNETSKWECSPLIYWQNKYDLEYFRALSGAVADDEETPANESLGMAAGRDVLWGTTAAHSVKTVNDDDYDYYEGSPIHPRTTYVPLIFRHIMSKITVNLVDDLAGSSDPGAALNLAGATIQFTNMANTGTIELHVGGITAGALSAKMLIEDGGSKRYGFYAANDETKTSEADKLVKLKDYVVVPQAFTDRVAPAEDAYIIITLADGTTYKLKLNTCQTLVTAATDETPAVYEDINKWESGKHYTYTIGLAKEQITFRAMIKDWVEKTGSGNANLEWD